VSLEVLTKVLSVAIVYLVTRPFGWGATIGGAIVASLLPDAIREFVKRHGWGRRQVGLLVSLIAIFDQFDKQVARALRRKAPSAIRRLIAPAAETSRGLTQLGHTPWRRALLWWQSPPQSSLPRRAMDLPPPPEARSRSARR
jgi:hypothetical protein